MSWICPCCKAAGIVPKTHTCQGITNAASAAQNIKVWSDKPKPLSNYNGGSRKLADAGKHKPAGFSANLIRKFDIVRHNWGEDISGRIGMSQFDAFQKKYTTADIANCSEQEFLHIIDEIWKEMVEFQVYGTSVNAMLDPCPGNHDSSLSKPGTKVFSTRGFCYRCDKREPASVIKWGFKPAYAFNPEDHVKDTIMQHCTTGSNGVPLSAGYWIGNRDIVSETSVCVARTLRGCGKFPKPEDVGFHYFYAFKLPSDKKGFDTEARQKTTGGRWLPGEKAFSEIGAGEVVAWTRIRKLGSDTKNIAFNSYQYQVLENLWHFTAHATGEDRIYLNAELNALTGGQGLKTITVMKSEDFVSGQ